DYMFLSFIIMAQFGPSDTVPLTRLSKLVVMTQTVFAMITITLIASRNVVRMLYIPRGHGERTWLGDLTGKAVSISGPSKISGVGPSRQVPSADGSMGSPEKRSLRSCPLSSSRFAWATWYGQPN